MISFVHPRLPRGLACNPDRAFPDATLGNTSVRLTLGSKTKEPKKPSNPIDQELKLSNFVG